MENAIEVIKRTLHMPALKGGLLEKRCKRSSNKTSRRNCS